MMRRTLTLEYWQDEGWYVGHLKDVPGVFSQGESLAELEENIRDTYQQVLGRAEESDKMTELLLTPIERLLPM